jgi:hypothetical protein
MVDRVQLLKLEDPSTGGTELDQFPTAVDPTEDHLEAAGVVLQDATNRDELVRVWRDGNDLKFQDALNTTPLTLTDLSTGGGISEAQHEALDTLVHDIDETSYEEYVYSGSKVTSAITWTSAAKTLKIREEQYTYSGSKVSQAVTIQYDGAGIEVMRTTEVYGFDGSKVTSVTRTKVP